MNDSGCGRATGFGKIGLALPYIRKTGQVICAKSARSYASRPLVTWIVGRNVGAAARTGAGGAEDAVSREYKDLIRSACLVAVNSKLNASLPLSSPPRRLYLFQTDPLRVRSGNNNNPSSTRANQPPNMAGGSGTTFTFYHYDPSLAGAIVVASLFGILTAVHTWQVARYRTLYFIPFVLGALFECVGYLGRVWSATQTPDWTLQPYIVQSLLILVAPALLAASVYMVLGRLVVLIEGGEKACPVPTRWLTKIFVAGDVLSFLIQGAGKF